MVFKTQSVFKRSVETRWLNERHIEKVLREKWMLFGVIPLFIRDSIITHNA